MSRKIVQSKRRGDIVDMHEQTALVAGRLLVVRTDSPLPKNNLFIVFSSAPVLISSMFLSFAVRMASSLLRTSLFWTHHIFFAQAQQSSHGTSKISSKGSKREKAVPEGQNRTQMAACDCTNFSVTEVATELRRLLRTRKHVKRVFPSLRSCMLAAIVIVGSALHPCSWQQVLQLGQRANNR